MPRDLPRVIGRGGGRYWDKDVSELYASMVAQFLPYVALAIATFVPQVGLAVALLVEPTWSTVPWWVFLPLVLGADALTLIFALAAVARFELVGRIEWQRDAERTLRDIIGADDARTTDPPPRRSPPRTHSFVRTWFGLEHAYFGFEAFRDAWGVKEKWYAERRFPRVYWLSQGRPILPVVSLAIAFFAIGLVIWPHVTWWSWPHVTSSIVFRSMAGILTSATALVGGWRLLRTPTVRSPRLERRAEGDLEVLGYFGEPHVTVNQLDGTRWALSTYVPSPRDPPRDAQGHDANLSALMARISQTLPRHYWTDRKLTWVIVLLAIAAATAAIVSSPPI